MANYAGKHYYKRSGDSFYQCEHYDIIDMYTRKKFPKLTVKATIISKQMIHGIHCKYSILISVVNESNNLAKYPYLALKFTPGFQADEYGLDGNRNTGLTKTKNNTIFHHHYCGGIDKVVYPWSTLDVNKFYKEIPKDEYPSILNIEYMITAENSIATEGKITIDSSDFEKS